MIQEKVLCKKAENEQRKRTSYRPLFTFGNSKKYRQCIQETYLEIKYFERALSKFIQKSIFIFALKPFLFIDIFIKK